MKKFISKNDYVPREHNHKEIEKSKSMTVPGQAFKIREIIRLQKTGVSLNLMRKAIFEGEDFPDGNPIRKQGFDLTDMDEIKEKSQRVIDKLEEGKKRQKEWDKKAENEKIKKQIKEEIEKEKEDLENGEK